MTAATGPTTSACLYDIIGQGYAARRASDPHIARAINWALGDARSVLNVGAGAGAYEPAGRDVLAVEPSLVMRQQRPRGAAPCVEAAAEELPFPDQRFDVAMAILSDHHWSDALAGLAEMRRVARRVIVICWDAGWMERFWLVSQYLPEMAALTRRGPSVEERALAIGAAVLPLPIPWDCSDGFLHANWRRPRAYLEPEVRGASSAWRRVGAAAEERAVSHLREDLVSGRWQARNRSLLGLHALDLGARILVSRGTGLYVPYAGLGSSDRTVAGSIGLDATHARPQP